MTALWHLREWFTPHEAAQYLARSLAAQISESDVMQLALDGVLPLALHIAKPTDARFSRLIDGNQRTQFKTIDGVWDLVLEGEGLLEVRQRCHYLKHLPYVHVSGEAGAHVQKDGISYQVTPQRGRTGMIPTRDSAFPSGATLVIRRTVLDAFISVHREEVSQPVRVEPASQESLGARERATLLTIIAALAKQCGIDWTTPSKSGKIIEGLTTEIGAPVSSRAIEEHLKRIPDALERRKK